MTLKTVLARDPKRMRCESDLVWNSALATDSSDQETHKLRRSHLGPLYKPYYDLETPLGKVSHTQNTSCQGGQSA